MRFHSALLRRRRTWRAWERDHERGAVAVEAAILIPLLAMLVFCTVEFTYLIRSHIAVTSMSRAGARMASAEPRVAGFTADAAAAVTRSAATLDLSRVEVWVYRASASNGSPPSSAAACDTSGSCVRYSAWTDPGGAAPGYFATVSGSWNPATVNACMLTAGSDQRDFVGVLVTARHDWITGAFPGSGTNVAAQTVMKFEPILVPPATVCR